jgi:hypothetical protein
MSLGFLYPHIDLLSIPSTTSLEVSHEDHPDASDEVVVSLASQMAGRNFLLHFKCDSWMERITFPVSLPQLSTSPEELTFNEHSNILEYCNPSCKNMKVYFDQVKYSTITQDNDFGFVALRKDLEVLALKDGLYMKSNGGSKHSKS